MVVAVNCVVDLTCAVASVVGVFVVVEIVLLTEGACIVLGSGKFPVIIK